MSKARKRLVVPTQRASVTEQTDGRTVGTNRGSTALCNSTALENL